MNTAWPATQRGLSFTGFVLGAIVLVLVAGTALKLIPPYLENNAIKRVFVAIANDPAMQKATVDDIRISFSKRASVEDIQAINAEDINVVSRNGKLVLSAHYYVKVPVAGNLSFYLDFKPSSAD